MLPRILPTLLTMACLAAAADPPPEPGTLPHLAAWMAGSFSSAAQAAADSAYYDIRLEMTPIWRERGDGPWLYVEQAVASHLDRPYRQRVYHLVAEAPGRFASEVHEVADPLRFAGAWREARPLQALHPDSLAWREGCAVRLEWVPAEGVYRGATDGRACASTLRGASWASSEVSVWADSLVSWDRGFDDAGEQVWGAEAGGYVFRRVARE